MLGYTVTLFSILKNCKIFPKWLHYFLFSSAVCEGFDFFTFSPTLVMDYYFEYQPPSQQEVVSQCGFDLHFPGG